MALMIDVDKYSVGHYGMWRFKIFAGHVMLRKGLKILLDMMLRKGLRLLFDVLCYVKV